MLLAGAVPVFPQQRGAEDADDGQVEGEADGKRPDGPQEGRHGPVELEPRPARRHVRDDALHLEVGSYHGADVEQLVAVALKQAQESVSDGGTWLTIGVKGETLQL